MYNIFGRWQGSLAEALSFFWAGNIGVRFAMSKCMMQNSIKDVFGQTKDDLFYHFAL
jgi:hypothetical protein